MIGPVIIVDNLSKQYRIGSTEDSAKGFLRSFTKPFRYLSSSLQAGKSDEILWALKDVSFEVNQGEVLGVIGRNGAGKSTLLKILSRITEPSGGRALLEGRIGSLLEVGTGFHPELTGRENIYLSGAVLGMKKIEIDQRFDEIVAFAEVERFLNTQVKRYSSGMYVRLAFAVAAHLEPEILLIDEVLAVGDSAFQRKCLGKIGDIAYQGRTVLFVSHHMPAIRKMCSRTMVIHDGRLAYNGPNQQAIDYYLAASGIDTHTNSDALHFDNPRPNPDARFEVAKIEILDVSGRLKESLRTGEYARFRITWRADEAIKSGGVELGIHTTEGVPLIQYSTQPVSAVDLKFKTGINRIDCEIPNLPLAAGPYVISIALTRPKIEWLYRNDQFAPLIVEENDVFNSGTPITSDRAYLVVPHQWLTA